ncbi:dTDP-4-dehydrorhamnose reductase [Cohnella faecalis]|uniref:dTDP-4-dehydrorhamnose reductase n=1 Tax=Cohnella faecalis TaxID=2315694 RepID=A0A398CLJ8_9BACL|nr:dTDP-4-dehydrorhamnose reductase [Cohnella faecalis]RIE02089.1 dTDP-4-dehydrorhamnose reductase [Cohnella faecalis]
MKVVVTGGSGQLGKEVMLVLQGKHEVYGLGRQELNVADPQQCKEVLDRIRPQAIIHCAAYTAVDKAETDSEQAYLVNATGTKHIAAAAESIGAKLCYISTDYVFDGEGTAPYRVSAPTQPRSVYGQSKLLGEHYARKLCTKAFVVRTSWVYGLHGANFVKTMLKLGQEKDSLKVVNDQIGSPTYTRDLAMFLLELIESDRYGVYHASNSGSCSWYEFASAIFEEAGINVQVEPCSTAEFPRPAPRPKYSVMDLSDLGSNGFQPMRPWREALRCFLQSL